METLKPREAIISHLESNPNADVYITFEDNRDSNYHYMKNLNKRHVLDWLRNTELHYIGAYIDGDNDIILSPYQV